ncbi:FecR family protein [Chitinophaga flava]|uniref:Iron dicitrate transport regulator FecR n=1 Tax=Chitinophaga flava TaxID=2259036 RepID=A0A365XS05_9BACT|nr:FecR family protein [Chitinophaga flava]RBL89137.1 iron dicitrate transport regulator FecR [Chitinophaga flava]
MLNKEEIRELLQRYQQGQCSREEVMMIESWYQQQLDKSTWDFQPGEEALIGARIKARIHEKLHMGAPADSQPAPLRAGWKKWYSMAAASLLLMAVAGGSYWRWHHTDVIKQPSVASTPQDVAPGGNKAILTLGNGSQIILDSAANGSLAQQGNTQVQKLVNGQIVYHTLKSEPAEIVYNTLTTPRGGQYQLRLPDGTQIWLNAASSITYPTAFAGKERMVAVTGEVYFEVAPDADKPFSVKAGDMTVDVLGTHFNVNAYADEKNKYATLLEGKVKIVRGDRTQLLHPGQQASITAAGEMELIKEIDVEQVMAWRNGKFIFRDKEDITAIMRQISRWYDLEVEYRGTVTKHFWGSVSRQLNASEVFKVLEATGGVHFKIEGKKVIVMP